MKVLVVYHSFTGQAQRVADRVVEHLGASGHQAFVSRVGFGDPAEPATTPIAFDVTKRWSKAASEGTNMPIVHIPPLPSRMDYDAVILLSNTWSMAPSVPIQTFIRLSGALAGKPVAIGIVCRGFWKKNLARTRSLVGGAGGDVVATEFFTHAGSWLLSTITNLRTMTSRKPQTGRRSLLSLPPFGVSPASLARVPGFVDRLVRFASVPALK